MVISLIHSIYNIVNYKLNSIKLSLIPLLFLAQIFISLLTTFIALNIPEVLIDVSKLITLVLILFNIYIVIKNDQSIRDYIFILIALSSVVESFSIFLTFIENYNLSVVQKAGRSFIYRGITGNINDSDIVKTYDKKCTYPIYRIPHNFDNKEEMDKLWVT